LGQAAGVAVAAAAFTVAVTTVIPERGADSPASAETASPAVPANQELRGSADAVERWLVGAGPRQEATRFGSADAVERWLVGAGPRQEATRFGSADAVERWLTATSR
jgi:hypothetical protein